MDRVRLRTRVIVWALCLLCVDAAVAAEPVHIEAVLAQPVACEFDAEPLDEALHDLKTRFRIPLVTDRRAMEDGGRNLDALRVTYRAKEIALENVLHDLLAPHQLEVVIRHDVAWITTLAAAESYYDTRAYQVTRRVPVERRMRSIMWSVEPGSWATSGGRGDIAAVPPNLLLIYQSPRRHREIRKAFADSIASVHANSTDSTPPATEMERKLALPARVDFQGVQFADAIGQLAKQHTLDIVVDDATIGFSGIAIEDASVTLELGEVRSLASALSLILDVVSPDLEWLVQDDAITITTADSAAEVMMSATYNVQDIAMDGDVALLIEAIQYTVASASWEIKGGNGTIKSANNGTTLEVAQSYPVHRTLRDLIADLQAGTN